MEIPDSFAHTGYFPVFRERIVSKVLLVSGENGTTRSTYVRALWDTGASMSVITRKLAEFLDLKQSGSIRLRGAFGSVASCETTSVIVCIVLGAATVPLTVAVAEDVSPDKDCDIVLGMDMISKGDFAFTHWGKQLVFSFRYPPVSVPVDFVELAKIDPRDNSICHVEEDSDSEDSNKCRLKGIVNNMLLKESKK